MNVTTDPTALELDDIQNGAIRPRPSPYVGVYFLLRIDERQAGRELLRRLLPALASATDPADPGKQAWVTAGLTFQGLKALGVPQDSLDSFPTGLPAGHGRPGRTARRRRRERAPALGTAARVTGRPRRPGRALARRRAGSRRSCRGPAPPTDLLPGVEAIWRQDVYALPGERTSFGFKDGISHPAIEGSGLPGTNRREAPFKAGEFVLGYRNEADELPRPPQPDVLGRNGTYVVFRKLHTRVAAYRQYLRAKSSSPAEEELLAAKFVGRWPSGAPADARAGAGRPRTRRRPAAQQRLPLPGRRPEGPQVPARARTPGG